MTFFQAQRNEIMWLQATNVDVDQVGGVQIEKVRAFTCCCSVLWLRAILILWRKHHRPRRQFLTCISCFRTG